ncbi:hypothetical protein Prudu_825S000300, partial [Prunus dulcis]
DNQAPGDRSTRSRDLRRVKLARTICRRSARDPPPGHSKFPRHHAVEVRGIHHRANHSFCAKAVEVRGIHHRANHSFRAKVKFCRKSLQP